MKYKDLGKMLSKNDMKNVMGGFEKAVCNIGVECLAVGQVYSGTGTITVPGICDYWGNACACNASGPEGMIHDVSNPTCNQQSQA